MTSTLKDLTSSFTSFVWPGFGGLGAGGSGLGIFRSGAATPPSSPGSKAEPYPYYPFFGRHGVTGCMYGIMVKVPFQSPPLSWSRPSGTQGSHPSRCLARCVATRAATIYFYSHSWTARNNWCIVGREEARTCLG